MEVEVGGGEGLLSCHLLHMIAHVWDEKHKSVGKHDLDLSRKIDP